MHPCQTDPMPGRAGQRRRRTCLRLGRAARLLAVALGVSALATASASAQTGLRLRSERCSSGCRAGAATPGAKLLVRGSGFRRGMKVVFTVANGGHPSHAAGTTRVVSSTLLHVRVPSGATSGPIYLRGRGSRSNPITLTVRPAPPPPPAPATAASGTPFDGHGMWIWYVSQSSGGTASGILAQANRHHLSTVFIKSSDGSSWWSQFSPALVAQLKAGGLHVCAWQYVYGSRPTAEARLGARAVTDGADCLAIDAEQQYEGRYSQAQQYITQLRAAIGPAYPVALASFPYVDYHPALPYSVFLGPNGAQFNVPQIYWKAIGVSVSAAVKHTYSVNAPYGRTIAPLGQAYDNTSAASILRFRQLTAAAGSPGASWWDWQSATPSQWNAIGQPQVGPAAARQPTYATLARGARGDLVVWAQEHLRAAGERVAIDGSFTAGTAAAVSRFQQSHGLRSSGIVDGSTWSALLRYRPVSWGAGRVSSAAAMGRSGPPSAWLPARRYEIPQRTR